MEPPSHRSVSWGIYPQLTKEQFETAKDAGIEPLHAQLLYNRGLRTPGEMKRFLRASYKETFDPLTLIDMPRAVERIRRALENREYITVYGDYDADGVTSSALLFRVLRHLKHAEAPLDYYIPHRLNEGCGLNLPTLDQLKARGTQLIITTDCASSDVEQVAYTKTLGIEVIITDHHHPPTILPDAYAMVNPWRPEGTEKHRMLCGVGVAFKLAQALYRAYAHTQEEELALLDLVAVGTIADIASLTGENHTLVRLGMERLNNTQKPGLRALIRSAGLQPGKIRERDIAFALGPRINAAGRMEHAGIAFELLTTDSEDEATTYAAQLATLNIRRQQETEELMRNVREQALRQPTQMIVLVSGDGWHEGILGLVAGKLAEEIHKTVLVLNNDKATKLSRGSARSQKGFNIIAALRSFAPRLERYGGHAQAAGFTIQSDRIEELHKHLLAWQDSNTEVGLTVMDEAIQVDGTTDQEPLLRSEPQMVDIVFTKMERLSYNFYKQMRLLSPLGAGNPEPIFKMEGLRLLGKWIGGKEGRNLHLRFGASSGNMQRTGILTRGAAQLQSLTGVSHVNIIFKLESSEDEIKQDVWLRILDIEEAHL
jgi:single-stranded-DNA-specific exonuclease